MKTNWKQIKKFSCKLCHEKYEMSRRDYHKRQMENNGVYSKVCTKEKCEQKALARFHLKKIESEEKAKARQEREKRDLLKQELGIGKYKHKEPLQQTINAIARYLDLYKPCYVLPEAKGIKQAGHVISISVAQNLRYLLLNIHGESKQSNGNQNIGDAVKIEGLRNRYGSDAVQALTEIRQENDVIQLRTNQYKEKTKIARQILKELKDGKDMTRFEIDERLGIYILSDKYSKFI